MRRIGGSLCKTTTARKRSTDRRRCDDSEIIEANPINYATWTYERRSRATVTTTQTLKVLNTFAKEDLNGNDREKDLVARENLQMDTIEGHLLIGWKLEPMIWSKIVRR